MLMLKTGVLLVNLGSPAAPTTSAVRRYLRQFLFDGRVLDIPALPRWFLVYCIISIFRSPKSAKAYQKIWGKRGSPLVAHSEDLVKGVQQLLGKSYSVRLGMRYGEPSIAGAIQELLRDGVDQIRVFPLYPQYAMASTASTFAEVMRVVGEDPTFPPVAMIGDFYDDPRFIEAFAAVAKPHLKSFKPDHLLFSYHGLPEAQMRKADRSGKHCLESLDCCHEISDANRFCYRAQCFATTRALQKAIGVSSEHSSLSFQSRLTANWIQPYTDEMLPILVKRGVKRLAVMCPAFVADCLETLEEIAMRAAEDWKSIGGEELLLIPSLNAEPQWCQAVADMVR